MPGSLVVVGLGFRAISDVTIETRQYLVRAGRVFFLSSNFIEESWICREFPGATSLTDCYRDGEDRIFAYRRMADLVIGSVREGFDVCMALYGHPGLCCIPGHLAIAAANAEGLLARMLPGISAIDWLVADLKIDIATSGFQSYGATDLVERQPAINPKAYLIIWQAFITGEHTYQIEFRPSKFTELRMFLLKIYSPNHLLTIYEAAVHSLASPSIEYVELSELTPDLLTTAKTLVLPPS